MKFKKETSRIPIQFVDSESEEILFEINNRNVNNMGEVFSDGIASSIISSQFRGDEDNVPDKIIILVAVELNRIE